MEEIKEKNEIDKPKSKRLIHFFDFLAIVLVFVILIGVLSPVLTPKNELGQEGRYNKLDYNFMAEMPNSIDVMFVGNSNLYSAVSPMCIWNKTGIACDVSGKAGQNPKGAYKVIQKVYEKQSPKIVFIEMDMFFKKAGRLSHSDSQENIKNDSLKKEDNEPEMFLDESEKGISVKDKKTRKFINRAINYVVKCSKNFDDVALSTITNYIPTFKFHDNWKNLKLSDFSKTDRIIASEFKGYILEFEVNGYNYGFDYMDKNRKIKNNSFKEKELFDQIISICKSKGSKVVLLGVPSAVSWSYKRESYVKKIAKENSVEFLDLNEEGVLENFNWSVDTRDAGDHLNNFGAEKVSSYLAEYLKTNYTFSDKRQEEEYSLWNKANEKYAELQYKSIPKPPKNVYNNSKIR